MPKFVTALIAAGALLGVAAMPASAAKHKTYHFFSKQIYAKVYTTAGKPTNNPKAGDSLVGADNDYLGNHKKHAKKVFATDHIHCTFLTVDFEHDNAKARCDVEIALPGGMLFADGSTVNLANTTRFKLTAGTGKYAKVKSAHAKSVNFSDKSNNSDLTLTL